MSETPTPVVHLGADPVDRFIPLSDQRQILGLRTTVGYGAYLDRLRLARATAHETQQREAALAERAEQSRDRDRRRYFDAKAPAVAALVLDWSAFDADTRSRLAEIRDPMELAVAVGNERRKLGLPIPVVRGPVDETFNARLRELQRQAGAETSRA